MELQVVEGNLLDQDVDAIVNAWNRNIIPWWLLVPQGVSRAIKKRAGYGPFRELAKKGSIPLGHAVATGPGKLPFKAIIHVAGINMLWRSTNSSIKNSTINSVNLARELGLQSIAIPLIGAGTGGKRQDSVLSLMKAVLAEVEFNGRVVIVIFKT